MGISAAAAIVWEIPMVAISDNDQCNPFFSLWPPPTKQPNPSSFSKSLCCHLSTFLSRPAIFSKYFRMWPHLHVILCLYSVSFFHCIVVSKYQFLKLSARRKNDDTIPGGWNTKQSVFSCTIKRNQSVFAWRISFPETYYHYITTSLIPAVDHFVTTPDCGWPACVFWMKQGT